MKTYRAAVIGCSRMGGFIDNEMVGSHTVVPPYSHGAGYYACDRTDLVACSDLREDVMQEFGKGYGVPRDRQYVDYRELIAREQPDIVSVATQPEHRAEIVIHAVEHGARAIYAEKAMAASMQEADAIVEAVEKNGVAFNLGTNRRWDPGYDRMKEVIDDGRLGALKSLIVFQTGNLFNLASHNFDLLLRLNSDAPVAWVQAHLPSTGETSFSDGNDFKGFDGDRIMEDPLGHGIIQFENGVTGYALLSGRGFEFEAGCESGVLTSLEDSGEWVLQEEGATDHRGKPSLVPGEFPSFQPSSTTLAIIEDLVRSLDTGEPPRGGVRVARDSMEMIFAFIESHRRRGARVDMPLKDCKLWLKRDRKPRQPHYSP